MLSPWPIAIKSPSLRHEVGGLPEMVDDGKTGFLVNPRDINALAEAIVRLMQNAEMRRTFGANGLRRLTLSVHPRLSDARHVSSIVER
jgi:glycosyltransferase involved in cell wall biosynthesis